MRSGGAWHDVYEQYVKIMATGLGTGHFPVMPGTAGTVVGVPVYLVFSVFPWPVYLLSTVALFFLAVVVSRDAARIYGTADPSCVVIDEIVGFVCTMFLVTPTLVHIGLGFVLFRFFDIVKPFPVRYLETALPVGYDIVGDDVAAAVYANIVLHSLIWYWAL